MIILSAGMPKSGTAWYYNLTNDLVIAAGGQDAREIREKFHLESVLESVNCRVDHPTFSKMARITVPHLLGKKFVIKTHSKPTKAVRNFMKFGVVKATYIYRDPRDVILSAMDHGERARNDGKTDMVFARFNDVKAAAKNAKKWLQTWDSWMKSGNVHSVRYEDLVADTVGELEQLSAYLGLKVPRETLEKIAATYQPDSPDFAKGGAINFNKGVVGRFKEVMSDKEIKVCQKHFGDYPQRMGYAGW